MAPTALLDSTAAAAAPRPPSPPVIAECARTPPLDMSAVTVAATVVLADTDRRPAPDAGAFATVQGVEWTASPMFALSLRYRHFSWTVRRRYSDLLQLHVQLDLAERAAAGGPAHDDAGDAADEDRAARRSDEGAAPFPAFPHFYRPLHSGGVGAAGKPRPPASVASSAASTASGRSEGTNSLDENGDLAQDHFCLHDAIPCLDRDGSEILLWQLGRLEAYVNDLFATARGRSPRARPGSCTAAVADMQRILFEFFQFGEASFLPAMGSKPYEASIVKRPGGRHADRAGRPVYSFFADVVNALTASKRKWLVLRSNHLSYYGGPDQVAPQEVMLLDRFTKLTVETRWLGSPRLLRVANDYRELTFRLNSSDVADELATLLRDNAVASSPWCQPQPYESFAPVRHGQHARWLVDGSDYFAAVADALEAAQHTVYIADWWLSPEVHLKRPCEEFPAYRLDRLLARKAAAGVQIYVLLYKEVINTMPLYSFYSKTALRNLHPNIHVLRHPDHGLFGVGPGGTLYWAHHEKMVVVDNRVAFLGGLDLCFGRYDVCTHPLRDQHPPVAGPPTSVAANAAAAPASPGPAAPVAITAAASNSPSGAGHHHAPPALERRSSNPVFPGKDYSNPSVCDFTKLHEPDVDLIDRASGAIRRHRDARDAVPRMPWHDVGVCVYGQAARDVAWHFVQRWNFVKVAKAKSRATIPFLLPVADTDDDDDDDDGAVRDGSMTGRTCQVQVLRSCARWSSGVRTEASIYAAYLDAIEHAEHYIYIENQFFVTTAADVGTGRRGSQSVVQNRVGLALYQRIKRAHREGRLFRVVVVVPLVPAFQGTFDDPSAASLRILVQRQQDAISNGPHSLLGRLRADGIDPSKYVGFFGLRSWTELDTLRTSVVYVHSKVLIVDDRIAIIGSANINDRSMLGFRDSEIAVRVMDTDLVPTTMGGQPWHASRFALELRLSLYREHLGVAESDPAAARLLDPVLESNYADLWLRRAHANTEIYREVFHCTPDDTVATWEEYTAFVATMGPTPVRSRQLLDRVHGHVVVFPTQFLNGESLLGTTISNSESLVSAECFV